MLSWSGKRRAANAAKTIPLILLPLFVFDALSASQEGLPRALAVGHSTLVEMTADRSLEFQVGLEAGNAYLFQADRGGFELKVESTGPDGITHIFDFPTTRDYPTHRDEKEIILLEPAAAGQYSFRIFTEDNTGAVSHPRISISRVHPDDEPVPAYRLMTEAASLFGRSQWQEARDRMLQAAALLDERSGAALRARCLMGTAILYYWEESDYSTALSHFEEAEQAYRASGDELLAMTALQFQATIRVDMAHEIERTPSAGLSPESQALFDEALSMFGRVLEIQRNEGRRYEAAGTLNLKGYTYWIMGEFDQAIRFYSQAADEYRELKEWDALSWPLNNIAVIDFDRGYLIRARDSFKRNLDILPEGESTADRAFWLDNLGVTYLELGELDLALKSFSAALELHESAADEAHKGDSLQGIGDTYLAFGESELGIEYLDSALPIFRKHSYGPGLVSLLNSMGQHYLELGDSDAALAAHREALAVTVSPLNRARTLLHLSDALVKTGEAETALEQLSEAGRIAENMEIRILEIEVLKARGDAWLSLSRFREAREAYRTADRFFAETGLAIERSQTLFGMSQSHAGLSEWEDAVQYAIGAIEVVENHRANLSTPQLRAFFMARRQDYYAHLIAALIEIHENDPSNGTTRIEEALSYSERSRARALVDLINEATQLGSDTARQDQRDALHKEMADIRYRLSLVKPDSEQRRKDIASTRRELAEIENRLNLLEIERRDADPAYANLVGSAILDAAGIQAMLDSDSALLQYALGSEQGFVFLVSRDAVQAWPLPGMEQIEQSARAIYEQIKLPSASRKERELLVSEIAGLARTVLPPAEALQQRRLLVVADGILQYLPFSVLLAANGNEHSGLRLSRHEVVNVPSMSVLSSQRGKAHREPVGKTIAIFADPVFTAQDLRLTGSRKPVPDAVVQVASRNPSNLSEPSDLERLPATAHEAATIASLVNTGSSIVRTGFEANREAVLNADLAEYRFVHFATHGKIDSRYPDLSWLAFSQVDSQGARRNGLVRLHDIYGLELNAELVTMSACDTALGREISGEGLTGLVQGFMYSGARSVLASLWQVPDRATAELMGHFYRNLLEQEQKPAEALRNAQVSLSSQARWRHPYYWSAFVLQGDWE